MVVMPVAFSVTASTTMFWPRIRAVSPLMTSILAGVSSGVRPRRLALREGVERLSPTGLARVRPTPLPSTVSWSRVTAFWPMESWARTSPASRVEPRSDASRAVARAGEIRPGARWVTCVGMFVLANRSDRWPNAAPPSARSYVITLQYVEPGKMPARRTKRSRRGQDVERVCNGRNRDDRASRANGRRGSAQWHVTANEADPHASAGPDTPPGHPARCVSRVTTTDGRSPGSRVAALSSSSQARRPSDVLMMGSPLTVAGAAAASDKTSSPRSLLIPRRGTVIVRLVEGERPRQRRDGNSPKEKPRTVRSGADLIGCVSPTSGR